LLNSIQQEKDRSNNNKDDDIACNNRTYSDNRAYSDNRTYSDNKTYSNKTYCDDKTYGNNKTYIDDKTCSNNKTYSDDKIYSNDKTYSDDKTCSNNKMYSDDKAYSNNNTYSDDKTCSNKKTYSDDKSYSNDKTYSDDKTCSNNRTYSDDKTCSNNRTYSSDKMYSDDKTCSNNRTYSDDKTYSNDRTYSDNKTYSENRIYTEDSSDFSKEAMDVSDDHQDMISKSTRNGCCCKDPSCSCMDLPQDSLDSLIPHFSDDTSRSWTTIYPSKTRKRMDDSCRFNAIRGIQRDERSNVHWNKYNKYDMIDTVDNWLPRSIYTDCSKSGNIFKERFTDSCKYWNERHQQLNRCDVWCRHAWYKPPQEPPEDYYPEDYEPAIRRWSTYSCIAEEDEESYSANANARGEKDCYTNTNRDEKNRPWVDSFDTLPEEISVCQTVSSALIEEVIACETLFKNDGECCEETPTHMSEDWTECRPDVVTILENSEAQKVRRLCKEFVAEKPPKDIAPDEPEAPPEEITVCVNELPDFWLLPRAPKETIPKTIPDSNFVDRDIVEAVPLNDAKDKPAKEDADIAKLNNQKRNENARNARNALVQPPDDKYNDIVNDIVASNNLTRLRPVRNATQNEQAKGNALNNQARSPSIPAGPIVNAKLLSKNAYPATLARTEFRNANQLTSNQLREVPKAPINETTKTIARSATLTPMEFRNANQLTSNQLREVPKTPINETTKTIARPATLARAEFRNANQLTSNQLREVPKTPINETRKIRPSQPTEVNQIQQRNIAKLNNQKQNGNVGNAGNALQQGVQQRNEDLRVQDLPVNKNNQADKEIQAEAEENEIPDVPREKEMENEKEEKPRESIMYRAFRRLTTLIRNTVHLDTTETKKIEEEEKTIADDEEQPEDTPEEKIEDEKEPPDIEAEEKPVEGKLQALLARKFNYTNCLY